MSVSMKRKKIMTLSAEARHTLEAAGYGADLNKGTLYRAEVLSGSMEPTFSTGDLILVKESKDFRVDDIVVYQTGSVLVVHRIVELRDGTVITRGDANNVEDAPIRPEYIKGTVFGHTSPIVDSYDTAVILNQQSLDKFESHINPGGTLIYDPYGIHRKPTRTDIKIVAVNAMDATIELGNAKGYNMILLGALLKLKRVVSLDDVLRGLKKALPERHHHLIPANEAAILKGMSLV